MTLKLICTATALLSLGTAAFSADMPIKAPRVAPVDFWPSGLYWGVDVSGGLNRDQLMTALAATTIRTAATGVGGGLRAGYARHLTPKTFIMLEVGVTRQNLGSEVACGTILCSTASKWSGDIGVDIASDAATITNLIPAGLFGGFFPAGNAVSGNADNLHPFAGAFAKFQQSDVVIGAMASSKITWQPGVRFGIGSKMTNNAFLKTAVEVTFSPNRVAVDPLALPGAGLYAGTTIMGRVSMNTGFGGLSGLLGGL